jgi:outer membrane immunogenic protein
VRPVFLVLVMGVLSGHAFAADLSVPPPPRSPVTFIPPPPVFTWSGIYIGGNGGYSFGTTTPSIGGLSGAGFSTNGAVAGGTIGGNYQTGLFVFGAEAILIGTISKAIPRPASVAKFQVLGLLQCVAA